MNKIALITGASSGIGEACAHVFAREGFKVILTGRQTDKLENLASALNIQYQTEVAVAAFDIRNKNEVQHNLETLPESWKKVDVLINNAGLSQGLEPINQGNPDDCDVMIDTNIKGLLYVSKVVSNWMIAGGSGHIVNLGSIAGKEVYPNGNVYCATKSAVDALNKAMRVDLLPHGIKVSAINPGAVETEFSLVRFKGNDRQAAAAYQGYVPLTAADIAETIFYCANLPKHVCINDLVITCMQQAGTYYFHKEK